MEEKKLTLEEKVDLLLAYQKKSQKFALVRMIFSILLFFIVVILPVIGVIWIGDYIKDSLHLNPDQFEQNLEGLKELLEFNQN